MTASKSHFANIVRCAELSEVRATSMDASVQPRAGDDSEPSARDRTSFTLAEERKALIASVSFEIALPYDEVRFTAAITYELRYEFNESLEDDADVEEAIQLFAERNPRYNAWPYLREYVNHMLSYAALPSIVLPLLKPFARPDTEPEQIMPGQSTAPQLQAPE